MAEKIFWSIKSNNFLVRIFFGRIIFFGQKIIVVEKFFGRLSQIISWSEFFQSNYYWSDKSNIFTVRKYIFILYVVFEGLHIEEALKWCSTPLGVSSLFMDKYKLTIGGVFHESGGRCPSSQSDWGIRRCSSRPVRIDGLAALCVSLSSSHRSNSRQSCSEMMASSSRSSSSVEVAVAPQTLRQVASPRSWQTTTGWKNRSKFCFNLFI